MIDKAALGEGTYHDCRNAGTVAPDAIAGRRCNVIPPPAMFVVRDDNKRFFPVIAFLHGIYNVRDMLLALQQARVSRMLIVGAQRLDEQPRAGSHSSSLQRTCSRPAGAAETGLRAP